MKKILGLTVVALLIMGLVGGGTWAYFSDPETSTGNILTAGTLDLTLGGSGLLTAGITDVYPGQGEPTATSASATLTDNGSIAGEMDIAFDTTITNTESSDTSELGVTYDEDGAGGELGAEVLIAVFLDVDGGGAWTSGDIGLESDSSTYTHSGGIVSVDATGGTTTTLIDTVTLTQAEDFYKGMVVEITSGPASGEARLITGSSQTGTSITVLSAFSTAITSSSVYTISNLQYDAINDYQSASWNDVYSGAWTSSPDDFVILWRVPTAVGNSIQGDDVQFDLTFTLEQTAAD